MRRPAALVLFAALHPSPNKRSLSVKAIVCCLILFLFHSGCATSGNIPGILTTPPSSGERALYGSVGVVQAYTLPKTDIDVVVKGRLKGAGVGAVAALVVVSPVLAGLNPTNSEEASILGATLLSAASFGAIFGAIMATPKAEAVSFERLVKEIPERTSPQQDLQDEVLRAGAEWVENQLVPVYEVELTFIDNVANYNALAVKGIQTVLEASVERIALGSKKGGSDPPLKLMMDARSRLIRARDGTVVNVARFRHTGFPRRFAEWAADNAALLNREYEDGIRKLALAIINWNFPGETGMEWPAHTIVVPEK
jgi:hypothetical protein